MSFQKPVLVFALLFLFLSLAIALTYTTSISQNSDDGTELNTSIWYESGFESSRNYLGKNLHEEYGSGFRFFLEDLNQGEEVAFARLRFASFGCSLTSSIHLLIEGVLQENTTTFSQDQRPSQKLPKTRERIVWKIDQEWLEGIEEVPLWYSSPDIAPIINEITSLPGWGTGGQDKTLIITLQNVTTFHESNYVIFNDYDKNEVGLKSPVSLEICKTVYDTFKGREFLGRVTDASATLNLYSLVDTDLYVEYGAEPGFYPSVTPYYLEQPAEKGVDIVLPNLLPNTVYYYRLCYRKADEGPYLKGDERSFHTLRSRGFPYVFSIQADEHVQCMYKLPEKTKDMKLYKQTLENMEEGHPDFIISLGDFAHTEFLTGRNAYTFQEAKDRYLLQREYIDPMAHSIPFYLVQGNHEGEQGWYYDGGPDNLAFISTKARKELIPNPYPCAFYSGNQELLPDLGFREDYYAWEWGDALFVVLNPYWYTQDKPYGSGGTYNGWDWTLGRGQYNWLFKTLHASHARWKFVFTHQLLSTATPYCYGRGGIEVAKYKVDQRPSFEWGGENEHGNYVFHLKRPRWSHGPIHDMLLEANVTAVFHGHDHFFAKQDLDGMVYLECPQPGDSLYSYGYKGENLYKYGDFLPNSGHIQVSVDPERVKIEYIRSYLPGDGPNGEIAYTCFIQ